MSGVNGSNPRVGGFAAYARCVELCKGRGLGFWVHPGDEYCMVFEQSNPNDPQRFDTVAQALAYLESL